MEGKETISHNEGYCEWVITTNGIRGPQVVQLDGSPGWQLSPRRYPAGWHFVYDRQDVAKTENGLDLLGQLRREKGGKRNWRQSYDCLPDLWSGEVMRGSLERRGPVVWERVNWTIGVGTLVTGIRGLNEDLRITRKTISDRRIYIFKQQRGWFQTDSC